MKRVKKKQLLKVIFMVYIFSFNLRKFKIIKLNIIGRIRFQNDPYFIVGN